MPGGEAESPPPLRPGPQQYDQSFLKAVLESLDYTLLTRLGSSYRNHDLKMSLAKQSDAWWPLNKH